MANVHDVAAYVLQQAGTMTTMKLQKLVYYCQAWHLVWEDKPLFAASIEAWSNGPVVPELYKMHRGTFTVSSWSGDPSRLKLEERSTIDAVVKYYGDKSPQWLSDLTHRERPWREARGNTPPGERSTTRISLESMTRYYASLAAG